MAPSLKSVRTQKLRVAALKKKFHGRKASATPPSAWDAHVACFAALERACGRVPLTPRTLAPSRSREGYLDVTATTNSAGPFLKYLREDFREVMEAEKENLDAETAAKLQQICDEASNAKSKSAGIFMRHVIETTFTSLYRGDGAEDDAREEAGDDASEDLEDEAQGEEEEEAEEDPLEAETPALIRRVREYEEACFEDDLLDGLGLDLDLGEETVAEDPDENALRMAIKATRHGIELAERRRHNATEQLRAEKEAFVAEHKAYVERMRMLLDSLCGIALTDFY